MADSNDNIRQIFYKDLVQGTNNPYFQINHVVKNNVRNPLGELYPFPVPYKEITIKGQVEGGSNGSVGQGNIIKFGYSCRPSLIRFPIYLKYASDTSTEYLFYIGNTGLFEVQPDNWMDVNNENEKVRRKQLSLVEIYQISLPWFTDEPFSTDDIGEPTSAAHEYFNEYESIIEFVQSVKTAKSAIEPKLNSYRYKVKPAGSVEHFSCQSHIVAKVDEEERFIFQVKEKIPTSGCGNCQDTVHATADENTETASYWVDDGTICRNFVLFTGNNERFGLKFKTIAT